MRNITFHRLLLFLFVILSTACSSNCAINSSHTDTTRNNLKRDSFLKIEKIMEVSICIKEEAVSPNEICLKQRMGTSGSGFVVKNDGEGVYVMTAAHVCDDESLIAMLKDQGLKLEGSTFKVIDNLGQKHDAKILKMDNLLDMCMTYVKGLDKPASPVSRVRPIPGDVMYNLAAPAGIYGPGMVPTMHGHYNGDYIGRSLYSIPAVGGSSGSPIFNHRGQIVGMIHSVYVRFPFLSISPRYVEVRDFIDNTTKKK